MYTNEAESRRTRRANWFNLNLNLECTYAHTQNLYTHTHIWWRRCPLCRPQRACVLLNMSTHSAISFNTLSSFAVCGTLLRFAQRLFAGLVRKPKKKTLTHSCAGTAIDIITHSHTHSHAIGSSARHRLISIAKHARDAILIRDNAAALIYTK